MLITITLSLQCNNNALPSDEYFYDQDSQGSQELGATQHLLKGRDLAYTTH